MGGTNSGGGGGFTFSPLPGGFAQATQGVSIVNSTPFGSGTSYGFNGTNGFINVNQGSDLALGTGDFTVEWYQNMTAFGSYPRVFAIGAYPTTTIGVSIEGTTLYYWSNNSINQSYDVSTGLVGTWNHFAIVRISNTTTIYRNGEALGSETDNTNINDTNTSLHIGQESPQSGAGAYFNGNITQFRWVKGLGVYTGPFIAPNGPLTYETSANPFGGADTGAIGVGYTKFIIGPSICTSNAQNNAVSNSSIGLFTGGFGGTLNNVRFGWYANGPGVINSKVTNVDSGANEITISGAQFTAGESYYFCSLPQPVNYTHNNSSNLTWPVNQNGYSLYTGTFDDGYDDTFTTTAIVVPSVFKMNDDNSSTNIYISTNGNITVGGGTGNWGNTIEFYDGLYVIAGNPGDLWLEPGNSLDDGDTQNIYYLVQGDALKWSLKLIIYCGHFGDESTPYSYVMNIYKDATHQWVETMIKSNTDNKDTGPYNVDYVGVAASTTSKVWRGDLNGQNWQYLGTGSVI